MPTRIGSINVKISSERRQQRAIGLGIKAIGMGPVQNRLARCRMVYRPVCGPVADRYVAIVAFELKSLHGDLVSIGRFVEEICACVTKKQARSRLAHLAALQNPPFLLRMLHITIDTFSRIMGSKCRFTFPLLK